MSSAGMSGMEKAIRAAEQAVGAKKPVRIIDGVKAGLTLLYSIIDEE
jgi:Asp/Glu/hydantoin racemase